MNISTLQDTTKRASAGIPILEQNALSTIPGYYLYNYDNSYYLNIGHHTGENNYRAGFLTLHSGSAGANNYINIGAINSTGSLKSINFPAVNGTVITTGNLNDITYINGGTI